MTRSRCGRAWLGALGALLLLVCSTPALAKKRGEDRFLSGIRQLSFEGRRSGEAYFSPDGGKLAFMSEREPGNPFFQVYVLDMGSGDVARVSPGQGKATCPYFQAGTGLLELASTHLDPGAEARAADEYRRRQEGAPRRGAWDYDPAYDIFLFTPEGEVVRRLTDTPGYDAEGAFSPDGSKIVFCSLRDAYPLEGLTPAEREIHEKQPEYFGEIYLMDADGSNQRRLTHWPGYDGGPFFTPDGERIVWRHFSEDGLLADIYTMRLDGTDIRRLTDFASMSWAPFFHPSGDYAIFTSNKLGFDNFELFLVDAAGAREPVQVTFTDGFDGLAAFSPDGRSLVWTSNQTDSGMSQLFLGTWDHQGALEALAASPLRAGGVDRPGPVTTAPSSPVAGLAPAIREGDLRQSVAYLADDASGGRLTGTDGILRAGQYIAAAFQQAGLSPAPGLDGYFQPFSFIAGVRQAPAGNALQVVDAGAAAGGREASLARGVDFAPLTFSGNGVAEEEIVFAGYGLVEPSEGGYNSYQGLDVTGKIVLSLRDIPEEVSPERRQELALYAGDRYKAKLAADRGAAGFLLAIGPSSANAGELIRFRESDRTSAIPIPAASVTAAAADGLLTPSGKTLAALQAGLDGGVMDPHAEAPRGSRVRLEVSLERIPGTCRNVLGYLPPSPGVEEIVLVGGHYDHIGTGEGLGSLARAGEEGAIHNGADDNASGTSVVLELAAALGEQARREPDRPRRGLLFAAWSGEELGLVGSSRFTEEPPVPLASIVAYFNFDMVGRLRDNRLIVKAVGSSPAWRGLLERRNVPAGFNLSLLDDPYLPTDLTSLYTSGVPGLDFFTDLHDDYNRPTDDPDTLNYDGMVRVARLGESLVRDALDPSLAMEYVRVQQTSAPSSGMGRRVYTGMVPDFGGGGDVDGMLVSDVRAGGPAEKAGVRGGDIVVEFAGKTIGSLQDYSDALRGAKIGEAVPIVVIRQGERITLTITPEARQQ